jgi:hypothetical protein
VYFRGDFHYSLSCVQKGSNHLREDDYYLICIKNIVRGFLCTPIMVLMSKRQVVRSMRSPSV